MARLQGKSAAACCHGEKERLMERLRKCDFCATSYEEHRVCRREAAVRSGDEGRECVVG